MHPYLKDRFPSVFFLCNVTLVSSFCLTFLNFSWKYSQFSTCVKSSVKILIKACFWNAFKGECMQRHWPGHQSCFAPRFDSGTWVHQVYSNCLSATRCDRRQNWAGARCPGRDHIACGAGHRPHRAGSPELLRRWPCSYSEEDTKTTPVECQQPLQEASG